MQPGQYYGTGSPDLGPNELLLILFLKRTQTKTCKHKKQSSNLKAIGLSHAARQVIRFYIDILLFCHMTWEILS